MVLTIKSTSLCKKFGNLTLFKDLDFSVSTSHSLAVTGPNGSGKSTLLEIITGIKKPTGGKLAYVIDSREVGIPVIREHSGFVSLRVNPYGELTALENLEFAYRLNTKKDIFPELAKDLLNGFNLYNARNKRVKYFSSGMKQRLRIILAVMHDPHILILDEPGSNLDLDGKNVVYSYIESVKAVKLIMIATNDEEEASLCNERINLGK